MIMTAYIPMLLAIIGLLVYAIATNAKLVEIGRLTFAIGLLVLTFELAKRTIHLP